MHVPFFPQNFKSSLRVIFARSSGETMIVTQDSIETQQSFKPLFKPSGELSSWRAGLPNAVMLLIVLVFTFIYVAPVEAHGRLGAAQGRCRLNIGPDVMNFTGYLPEASKNEFCEDIPSTGPVIMVLDAEQAELRDMKVELRIVKDVGSEEKENENLEAVTVAYHPPTVYPSGTINFEHTFDEPGYFVGIVTVLGDHGERWVSRFPFSVAKTFMRDLPMYLLLGLGVLACYAVYIVHRRRSPLKKTTLTDSQSGSGPDSPSGPDHGSEHHEPTPAE
jgi:hypothetical protein